MSDAGKGDKSRVRDYDAYRNGWDNVFNKLPTDKQSMTASDASTNEQKEEEDNNGR